MQVTDKRNVVYRDKRMEKLFPGQGYSLSPEKNFNIETSHVGVDDASEPKDFPNLKFESKVDGLSFIFLTTLILHVLLKEYSRCLLLGKRPVA